MGIIKMAQIKKEYKDKVVVAKYLFNEYVNELRRDFTNVDGIKYRATRKSRLERLRIELNDLLKDIGSNYSSNIEKVIDDYYEEI